MKRIFVALLAAASAMPAMAQHVAVYAGYDDSFDTSFFQVDTDTALTNVKFTGVGVTGSAAGLTGEWDLSDLPVGNTGPLYFLDSGVFSYDYDDVYWGESAYTFQADAGAHHISLSFSPSNNLTGGFVGFLGNDSSGFEWDADIGATKVAETSAAPEPASWAMMLGGFGLVGGAMRARRKSVAFA
jgi:hypothetical protein